MHVSLFTVLTLFLTLIGQTLWYASAPQLKPAVSDCTLEDWKPPGCVIFMERFIIEYLEPIKVASPEQLS